MWLSMMLTAAEASMLVFFCVVPVWAEDDSSVLSERSPVSGSVPETAAVTASCCAPALTVIVPPERLLRAPTPAEAVRSEIVMANAAPTPTEEPGLEATAAELPVSFFVSVV